MSSTQYEIARQAKEHESRPKAKKKINLQAILRNKKGDGTSTREAKTVIMNMFHMVQMEKCVIKSQTQGVEIPQV